MLQHRNIDFALKAKVSTWFLLCRTESPFNEHLGVTTLALHGGRNISSTQMYAMFTGAANFAANFAAKKIQRAVGRDPKVSYFLPSVQTHIFALLTSLLLVLMRSRKCRRTELLPVLSRAFHR